MSRERRNGPSGDARRRRPTEATERIRRRLTAEPDVELSPEELRALADEGIDPEELRRAAAAGAKEQEASIHDRDTARDQLESLVTEEDDY